MLGQRPEMAPAFPESSICFTGTGTGDGGTGGGVGVGVGAGAGGVGVGVGGGVGVGAGGGADAALCVAVTVEPATATESARAGPEFADTTTRNVASPRPVSDETVAHATSLFADHEHAECA